MRHIFSVLPEVMHIIIWLGHILMPLHIVFAHVWNMLKCFMLPGAAEMWVLPVSKLWLESFHSRRISVVRSGSASADDQLTEKEFLTLLKFENTWMRNVKGFLWTVSQTSYRSKHTISTTGGFAMLGSNDTAEVKVQASWFALRKSAK